MVFLELNPIAKQIFKVKICILWNLMSTDYITDLIFGNVIIFSISIKFNIFTTLT